MFNNFKVSDAFKYIKCIYIANLVYWSNFASQLHDPEKSIPNERFRTLFLRCNIWLPNEHFRTLFLRYNIWLPNEHFRTLFLRYNIWLLNERFRTLLMILKCQLKDVISLLTKIKLHQTWFRKLMMKYIDTACLAKIYTECIRAAYTVNKSYSVWFIRMLAGNDDII